MKRILMIVCVLSMSMSFAQQDRSLKLDKEKDLIEVTYYHDNGTVSETGFYTKEGKLHGEWYSYCQEGKKIVSAKYDNGVKIGKWFYWQNDQLKEVDYSKGTIVSVSEWTNKESVLASNN